MAMFMMISKLSLRKLSKKCCVCSMIHFKPPTTTTMMDMTNNPDIEITENPMNWGDHSPDSETAGGVLCTMLYHMLPKDGSKAVVFHLDKKVMDEFMANWRLSIRPLDDNPKGKWAIGFVPKRNKRTPQDDSDTIAKLLEELERNRGNNG